MLISYWRPFLIVSFNHSQRQSFWNSQKSYNVQEPPVRCLRWYISRVAIEACFRILTSISAEIESGNLLWHLMGKLQVLPIWNRPSDSFYDCFGRSFPLGKPNAFRASHPNFACRWSCRHYTRRGAHKSSSVTRFTTRTFSFPKPKSTCLLFRPVTTASVGSHRTLISHSSGVSTLPARRSRNQFLLNRYIRLVNKL